jgi:hypothetical protein
MSDVRTILERGVGGATPPPDGFERMLRRRDRKRRNQRIAAGAVGIAIFVAAVWIVTTGGPLDRSQPASTGPTIPPASERVGFIGLPPEGATPSAPQGGELVLSLGGRSTTDDGLFLVWVYADGRLIWEKEGDFPYGANEVTTGLLEQRLTPDGVERMRSEIVSTGLFADDLNLLSTRGVIWGTIRVRHGDRLVRVDWSNPDIYPRDHGTVATLEQSSTLVRLDALLTHPISWLPTSAWEDQEIGAYVPSRFAVCYEAAERGIDPSRILSVLPASAEELLRAKNRSQNDPNDNCTEVTVEEARALAEAFNDAGLEQEERSSSSRLGFVFDPPVPLAPGPIENAVSIYFEPYLPHGLFQSCSPCG